MVHEERDKTVKYGDDADFQIWVIVLSFCQSVWDGTELKLRQGNGLSHSTFYKQEI